MIMTNVPELKTKWAGSGSCHVKEAADDGEMLERGLEVTAEVVAFEGRERIIDRCRRHREAYQRQRREWKAQRSELRDPRQPVDELRSSLKRNTIAR